MESIYGAGTRDEVWPKASEKNPGDTKLQSYYDNDLLGGAVVIEAEGRADERASWQADTPYRPLTQLQSTEPARLRALPYFLWGNRQPGEMTIWIRTCRE